MLVIFVIIFSSMNSDYISASLDDGEIFKFPGLEGNNSKIVITLFHVVGRIDDFQIAHVLFLINFVWEAGVDDYRVKVDRCLIFFFDTANISVLILGKY